MTRKSDGEKCRGKVTRKRDEDWLKKCMEFRVEGRRPAGRPIRTWLERVEADMTELEIDREDVHDRKKWRNNQFLFYRYFEHPFPFYYVFIHIMLCLGIRFVKQ